MIFISPDQLTRFKVSPKRKPAYEIELQEGTVYVTSPWQLDQIHKHLAETGQNCKITRENILEHTSESSIPRNIGFGALEEQLDNLPRGKLKIGIINGLGRAFGDNLVGMTALRAFRKRLASVFDLEIILYQFIPSDVIEICQRCDCVDRVVQLPASLESFLELDAYIDLVGKFHTVYTMNLVDWYLTAFSLDPNLVPQSEKQNFYATELSSTEYIRTVIDNHVAGNRPLLLFHHRADARIRCIPKEVAVGLVKEIICETEFIVVSALGLQVDDPRFIDLSNYSNSTDKFASIISMCDAVVTVDTITCHLANAFSKPTYVLFTTLEPDLRIRYYANATGVLISDSDGPLIGLNSESKDDELRREQLELVRNHWAETDFSGVIKFLKSLAV